MFPTSILMEKVIKLDTALGNEPQGSPSRRQLEQEKSEQELHLETMLGTINVLRETYPIVGRYTDTQRSMLDVADQIYFYDRPSMASAAAGSIDGRSVMSFVSVFAGAILIERLISYPVYHI